MTLRSSVARRRPAAAVEPADQFGHPFALGVQFRFAPSAERQDGVDEVGAQDVAQFGQPSTGLAEVGVGGQSHPEAELGVVFEQGVRPGGPAPLGVGRPGRGRQVAAVDRRAAGGVGDHQPVAEQLRQQFQVGRLAATGARAGEFEQRLQELRTAHGPEVHPRSVCHRQRFEERDVLARGGDEWFARRQVDRLGDRRAGDDGRAGLDAQPASGAVLDVHLQRVAGVGQADRVQWCRGERRRRVVESVPLVERGPNNAVRAHECAVAALDTGVRIPHRHEVGDVALLVGRGAAGIAAVHRQGADRQRVPASGDHLRRSPFARSPGRRAAPAVRGRGWR